MSHRGFDGLHNDWGLAMIMMGFLLVTLIIVAGGVFVSIAERGNRAKRRALREQLAAQKQKPSPKDS